MAQLKQSTIKDQFTLDLGSDKTSLVMTTGDDGLHPKLSVLPGSNLSSGHGDLEIINASAKANQDSCGITLTCSDYIGSANFHSLTWAAKSNTAYSPCLYYPSLVSQAQLGSASYPWGLLYLRASVNKDTTIKEANLNDGMQELLKFNSNVAVTPTSGSSLSTDSSEGDITGGFEFNCNHLEKSFTDHGQWTTSKLRLYSDGFPTACQTIIEAVDTIEGTQLSHTSNTLTLKASGHQSDMDSGSSYAIIKLDLKSKLGKTTTVPYEVYFSAEGYSMSFTCSTSGPGGTSIGSHGVPWGYGYFGRVCTSGLVGNTDEGISVTYHLYPSTNSTSSSTGYTLGTSSKKWRYVYAYSGAIQTSDRSAKDSIHYIDETEVTVQSSTSRKKAKAQSSSNLITTEDVIDFVSNLNPVTFCYKSGQGEDVQATEDNTDPEEIQLGLIADDIKNHKLFKYIGVETNYEEEVSPEVKDDEGNVVTAAVTETKTTLGLQAIPLATAALTACKYLLTKNQELEDRLNAIEAKLDALTSN